MYLFHQRLKQVSNILVQETDSNVMDSLTVASPFLHLQTCCPIKTPTLV